MPRHYLFKHLFFSGFALVVGIWQPISLAATPVTDDSGATPASVTTGAEVTQQTLNQDEANAAEVPDAQAAPTTKSQDKTTLLEPPELDTAPKGPMLFGPRPHASQQVIPPGTVLPETITAEAIEVRDPTPPCHAANECRPIYTLPKALSEQYLNRLWSYDQKPLAGRTPVVVLPGRAEEKQARAWWHKLYVLAQEDPSFRKHYKLYLYPYNSWADIDQQAAWLRRAIETDLLPTLPKRQNIVMVGYSLGGIIIQEAVDKILAERQAGFPPEKEDLLSRTGHFMMIAVPFHGTPVFNPPWYSRNISSISPIRRWWDRVVYHWYMNDASNLHEAMGWDNYDGTLPDGALPDTPSPPPTPDLPEHREFRQKIIAYAGYLNNRYVYNELKAGESHWLQPGILVKPVQLPKAVLGTILPAYGFSVNAVLNFMNKQLAQLPTYTEATPGGKNVLRFRFNDGVIPLDSALYLPQPPDATPYAGHLDEILTHINIGKARVFEGKDHIELGEYRILRWRLDAQDLLEPALPSRSINQWLLYDLNALVDETPVLIKPTVPHTADSIRPAA